MQSDVAAAQTADLKKRFFIQTSQAFVMEAISGQVPDCKHGAPAFGSLTDRCPNPKNRD
jgi:hypothetical protein